MNIWRDWRLLTRIIVLIFGTFILFGAKTSSSRSVSASPKFASLLVIQSAIGPGVADYIQRGLKTAAEQNSSVVILQIDTPGGLSKAMRAIIKAILDSSIPVVGYVAPSGARAASAGTYILYACSFAGMAPGTNLGAATPIAMGSPINSPKKSKPTKSSASQNKALQDARAYIRSLAQLRGRNVQWAEQAVTKGASLSAQEALQKNVINFVASNLSELLQKINGKQVRFKNQSIKLHTLDLSIKKIQPDWRSQFLTVISDPSVAYILLMIGFYGLFFEFLHPGMVVPGVLGGVALIISLYALQLLPINFAGLGLIVLGLGFLIAEAFLPSFGILGVGGVISFIVGSIFLLEHGVIGLTIPIKLIIAVAIVTVLFMIFTLQLAFRSRRRAVVSGREAMIGKVGIIQKNQQKIWVKVDGELWQVYQPQSFFDGQRVKVVKVHGLALEVVADK